MRRIWGTHAVAAVLEVRPGSVRRLLVERESRQEQVIALARSAGVRVEPVTGARLQELAQSGQHQGLLAEAEELPEADLRDVVPSDRPALVLALDSVQDPHNLGALVRSAECFGATGVVFPQDRSAPLSGAAAKAAAGALERLPLARVVNLARALEELKALGPWITGLVAEDEGEPLSSVDLTGPSVLVVGAEGSGLRPLVKRHCDRRATIPLTGRTQSLNASVAGAVALYEAVSQRRRTALAGG